MLKIRTDDVEKIIAEVAESCIVPRFRALKAGDVAFKGEDDPVTIADKEAEIALSRRLLDLLPASKVVGEEAFALDSGLLDLFSGDSPVWIVDPVDGTKAFIAGEPFYGVIVALAERNQTVAAWLYDPTSKEFIVAEKGAGAYHKGQKLSVLKPSDPCEITAMRGTVGRRIKQALEKTNAQRAGKGPLASPTLLPMLSACHDYAALAVGGAHFSQKTTQTHFSSLLETCTPWDCAAGVLIHAESGGYTAHWNGEAFCPSHYRRGLLSAPDPESWRALRLWISGFCAL